MYEDYNEKHCEATVILDINFYVKTEIVAEKA